MIRRRRRHEEPQPPAEGDETDEWRKPDGEHAQWQDEHAPQPGPSERDLARQKYDAYEIQIERLRDELARWPAGHDNPRRRRKERRLAELEEQQRPYFAILNPPAIGSPFGLTEAELAAREPRFYCRVPDCGVEISRRQSFDNAKLCADCLAAYRETHWR